MKLNDPKKAELKRENICYNAKHAKLHSDLVQAPKWAPQRVQGFSAEGTLISTSVDAPPLHRHFTKGLKN